MNLLKIIMGVPCLGSLEWSSCKDSPTVVFYVCGHIFKHIWVNTVAHSYQFIQ